MEESTTYQYILEEGAIREAKKILVLLGQKRLGPPTEATTLAVQALSDLERLERILDRVPDVASWQELLATP